MTFVIKHRGAKGSLVVAEYRCTEHGVFEATVERDDNGDPPTRLACPEIVVEQQRNVHSTDADGTEHAYYEDRICEEWSAHVISAPKVRNLTVIPTAVMKGGDTERRPGMLDTRPLAEGMPMKDWKKLQKGITEDRRHKQMLAKGLKSKRIQVG